MASPQQTTQAVRTALEQARTDLESAQAERARLADELAATDQEVERLDTTVARLTQLVQTLDGQQARTRPAERRGRSRKKSGSQKAGSLAEDSRTNAVWRVLDRAGQPLRLSDVASRLRKAGRDDAKNQVSAALSYLARKERVIHDKDNSLWSAA